MAELGPAPSTPPPGGIGVPMASDVRQQVTKPARRLLPRRPRILPVLIIAGVTICGFRVGDLAQSGGLRALLTFEQLDLEPGRTVLAQDEIMDPEASGEAEMAEGDEMAADEETMVASADGDEAMMEADDAADPEELAVLSAREALNQIDQEAAAGGGMTEAELDMLMSLAEHREALQLREADIEGREALLKAAELRIDEKINQLDQARAEIEALIGNLDEAEEERLARLVQVYEIMKPAEAARIFDGLERDVLLEVLERMNERKLAPVMANMNPALAQELTADLALRRRLPELPEG